MQNLTHHLKAYDYKLYVAKNKEGTLCVYRHSKRSESYEIDGVTVINIRPAPHLIFSLTDNWKSSGLGVEWGIEPIMERLRSIDLWQRNLAAEIEEQHAKADASVQRDAMREHDAFARQELRPVMKKEFATTLTHNLDDKRYRKVMEKCR